MLLRGRLLPKPPPQNDISFFRRNIKDEAQLQCLATHGFSFE